MVTLIVERQGLFDGTRTSLRDLHVVRLELILGNSLNRGEAKAAKRSPKP